MPPKRKAPAAAAAAAGKGNKKVYGKAPELPEGEILTDHAKNQWKLSRAIGTGGFGRIYSAAKVIFWFIFGKECCLDNMRICMILPKSCDKGACRCRYL